jgi:hypothetical protein
MSKREKHELFSFMKSLKDEMAAEYRRIQKRSTEDPGTAGDQAEENWASLLRNWLPSNYPIVTKGRIINHEGLVSPQVDVLVLHPSYPHFLRNKKLYFAGGVAAVFECKLTLRNEDLKKTFKNAAFIKKMIPAREGNPYDELHKPVICGLLAHSHEWKKKGRAAGGQIFERIHAYETKYIDHPSDMIDLICVADVATFVLNISVYLGPVIDEERLHLFEENAHIGGIMTSYVETGEAEEDPYNSDGDLFATLIRYLTTRLAFEDINLRTFAEYLTLSGGTAGIGRIMLWKPDVLSSKVLDKLNKNGCSERQWSKWQKDLY